MDNLQRLRAIRALKGVLNEPSSADEIIEHLRAITDSASAGKAGYSLRGIGADDWNGTAANRVKPLRVGIVGNFICGELENYLRFELLRERICPELYVGDFDQYVFEMMNDDGELNRFAPELTLCLLDEHAVTDRLSAEWLVDELDSKLAETAASLRTLFSDYARKTHGLLVFNTLSLSSSVYDSIIDYRSKVRMSRAWRAFNMQLLELASEHKNIVAIDIDQLLQKPGVRLRDARMAAHAKMYMDDSLLAALAAELRKIAQSLAGKTKKCLVLDCDNTLWGGIIGDDGLEGIALGGSPEGEAYVAFHKTVKRLIKQGIIATVNSKNDKANTDRVFDSHPDTLLKQEDFAAQCVNWEPKHENIKSLAARINIGTEHMVFVDDSAFECTLVKDMMPEVNVVQLTEEAAEHVDALLAGGWFNTLELTGDDYKRAEQYRSEAARENLRAAHSSYEDYLRDLAISVDLFVPDDLSLPRVAQLTQRTNQFNLTTWRLSEPEVRNLIDDERWLLVGIRAADRFGDNGMVGALFVRIADDPDGGFSYVIRNFLLSCRVFSRSIEHCALREILVRAREAGAASVYGEYLPTSKNAKFETFFESAGFVPFERRADGTAVFKHTLQDITAPIDWIEVDSNLLETQSV
ncbi:MAG: HAD-IIIC family phosphatase [Gammaproteobacteria bacterium]